MGKIRSDIDAAIANFNAQAKPVAAPKPLKKTSKSNWIIYGLPTGIACCCVAVVAMIVLLSGIIAPSAAGAHEHQLQAFDTIAASCSAAGNTGYWYCEQCDEYFGDADGIHVIEKGSWYVAPLGHNIASVSATEATCFAAGNNQYWECRRCHEYYQDEQGKEVIKDHDSVVLAQLNHKLKLQEKVDPTCTTGGNKAYYECEHCHNYFDDDKAATAILNKATVNVAALGHSLKYEALTYDNQTDKVVCLRTRTVAHYHCTRCNHDYADTKAQTKLTNLTEAAIGHNFTYSYTYQAATCERNGQLACHYCVNCHLYYDGKSNNAAIIGKSGAYTETIIPKLTHTFCCPGDDGFDEDRYHYESAKAATCTDYATNEYWQCKLGCGKYYFRGTNSNEFIGVNADAFNSCLHAGHGYHQHAMGGTVAAVPATCTTTGTKEHYFCANCRAAFVVEVDATGDSHHVEKTAAQLSTKATGHDFAGDKSPIINVNDNAVTVTRTCAHEGCSETEIINHYYYTYQPTSISDDEHHCQYFAICTDADCKEKDYINLPSGHKFQKISDTFGEIQKIRIIKFVCLQHNDCGYDEDHPCVVYISDKQTHTHEFGEHYFYDEETEVKTYYCLYDGCNGTKCEAEDEVDFD